MRHLAERRRLDPPGLTLLIIMNRQRLSSLATLTTTLLSASIAPAAPVHGWLSWRGPEQTGVSRETGLPSTIASEKDALWTADFPGGSTAVIANGRLHIVGHLGDGPELQEGLACFDDETGELQ